MCVCVCVLGGGGVNVCVCVCGSGEGAEPGKGRYMNNFVFCFFAPPSPTFHVPPSSASPPFLPSSLPPPPQSPPPAGCLILSRFQQCRRPPGRAASLLMEFGGKGCGSRPRRSSHNKPAGGERLPSAALVRKHHFQRRAWKPKGK